MAGISTKGCKEVGWHFEGNMEIYWIHEIHPEFEQTFNEDVMQG